MASEMQIKVGADVKDALTGMAALAKEVKLTDTAFEKAFKNISDSVDTNVAAALADTQKLHKGIKTIQDQFQAFGGLKKFIPPEIPENFRRLSTSVDQTAASVGKLTPKIGGANTTLINFGRVVQDAPFGIMGIANNIDPLLLSFQRLKAETGSSTAAFKALGATLLGPAGIGIAVSAVTSALIAFGPEIKGLFTSTSVLDDAFKDLSGSISTTTVKAFALVDAIKSGELTTLELKSAQKELIAINPEFRGAFAGSKVDVDLLNAALDNTIKKILQTIKVSAATSILEKEFAAIAKTILSAGKNLTAFQRAGIGKFSGGGVGIVKGNLDAANVSLATFDDRIREVLESLGVLSTEFVKPIDAGVKILGHGVDKIKEYRDVAIEINKIGLGAETRSQREIASLEEKIRLQEELNRISKEILANAPKRTPGDSLGGIINDPNAEKVEPIRFVDSSALKDLQGINEKALDLSGIINNGINGGIDQFFNALANNQDPFEALKQSVKRLVVELGAAVVKMLILKTIANAIAPGVGGSAVDGAGKLFGNLFSNLSGSVRGSNISLTQLNALRG